MVFDFLCCGYIVNDWFVGDRWTNYKFADFSDWVNVCESSLLPARLRTLVACYSLV